MNASHWPEDHSKKLASLVTGGEKSYAQIAGALNAEFGTEYSRNSCIGRAGRMGLSKPFQIKTAKKEPGPPLAKRTRLIRSNSNSTALRLIQVNEPTGPGALRCVEVESRHLALLDLEPNDCRYPDPGEGPDFKFCGNPKLAGGSSYCPSHFVLTKGKSYQISEADHERRRRHFMGLNKQSVKAMGVPA
jgi:GcrA cell cycle regulator